jgi:hypothetical protein
MMTFTLKPCPVCQSSVSMTYLEEMDERRYFERRIECDNCDLSMRDSIGWSQGKDRSETERSDEIGRKLSAKWNSRIPEEIDGPLSVADFTKFCSDIRNERKLIKDAQQELDAAKNTANAAKTKAQTLRTQLIAEEKALEVAQNIIEFRTEDITRYEQNIQKMLNRLDEG